jgi:hypothetical protein
LCEHNLLVRPQQYQHHSNKKALLLLEKNPTGDGESKAEITRSETGSVFMYQLMEAGWHGGSFGWARNCECFRVNLIFSLHHISRSPLISKNETYEEGLYQRVLNNL